MDAAGKPDATPVREGHGLTNFRKTKQLTVEPPSFALAADRSSYLDVVESDDLHPRNVAEAIAVVN